MLVVAQGSELVGSGEAARVLGVHRGTLRRWWDAGLVKPARVTAGGQARWDVADLEQQVARLNER